MDLVVTVPQDRWKDWLAEGDCADTPPSGREYEYTVGTTPPIARGERLYIAAYGKLRGYAPVTAVSCIRGAPGMRTRYFILRRGDAVACTIDEPIQGFRGWRTVWWPREAERPFPQWRDP